MRSRKPRRKRKPKTSSPIITPDIDWKQRYGNMDVYKILCARTHAATNGVCCVCMKAASEVIHHTRYLGPQDSPGSNVFAVCVCCHKHYCHNRHNWIKSKTDPLWGNHNTVGFEKRLQASYKLLNNRKKGAEGEQAEKQQ